MMNLKLLAVSLIIFTHPLHADVYKSIDENGNVIFTDKPSPDAEKIKVDKVQTIDSPDVGSFEYTPPAKPEPSPYSSLEITNPQNDSAMRDNGGNVTVSIAIEPGLDSSTGDKLVLYVDGNRVQEGTSNQFRLSNVDRGTHSLSVAVVDNTGNELKRSTPISFTLLRHSVQQANKLRPPPP